MTPNKSRKEEGMNPQQHLGLEENMGDDPSCASPLIASPAASRGYPEIGSIWREHDGRFVRHVEVVGFIGFAGSAPHKMVFIQTVSADDGRAVSGRTTKAKLSAFGKRYRLVSSPEPASAAANQKDPQ